MKWNHKLVVVFVCFVLIVGSGCTQVSEEPVASSTVESSTFYHMDESGFSITEDVMRDELVTRLSFPDGRYFSNLSYPLDFVISDEEVKDDLVLFDDFSLYVVDQNTKESVILSFHDGHELTVDDVTISVSKMPFDVRDALPFSLYLPEVIDSLGYGFVNETIFPIPLKVVLKDGRNLLSELKDERLDFYHNEGHDDFMIRLDEISMIEVSIVDGAGAKRKYLLNRLGDFIYQYRGRTSADDLRLENHTVVNQFIEEIASTFVCQEGSLIYLLPLQYEDEKFIITADLCEETYGAIDESFLDSLMEKGFTISERTDHYILLTDENGNLYEYCAS